MRATAWITSSIRWAPVCCSRWRARRFDPKRPGSCPLAGCAVAGSSSGGPPGRPPRPARAALQAVREGGEDAVPEQVHLHQPDRLHAVLVHLRDHGALGRGLAGHEGIDGARSHDHPARVQAEVTRGVDGPRQRRAPAGSAVLQGSARLRQAGERAEQAPLREGRASAALALRKRCLPQRLQLPSAVLSAVAIAAPCALFRAALCAVLCSASLSPRRVLCSASRCVHRTAPATLP